MKTVFFIEINMLCLKMKTVFYFEINVLRLIMKTVFYIEIYMCDAVAQKLRPSVFSVHSSVHRCQWNKVIIQTMNKELISAVII